MTSIVLRLLLSCGLRRHVLRRIAEEGDREVAGDGNELSLHQIEKLVETLAQNDRYVERPEDAAQPIQLFRGIVAVTQQITRLDFTEQPASLAHAMMQRARESLVEEQKARHPRRARVGRVQAAIGMVPGRRAQ